MRRKVLAGYTAFIDGIDYLGVVDKFTPPPVEAEVVQSNMPGHAGPFDILTGRVGALEAMITVADAFPALEALCADPEAVDTPVQFIGVTTDGETRRQVTYELAGVWKKQERGEIAGPEGSTGGGGGGGGNDGGCTYTVNCRTFTHTIDGGEVRHIDLEQNIHRIAGRDVLETLRAELKG